MTEVQDTTDRNLKWMRRIARILALIWAGLGTLLVVAAVVLYHALTASPLPSRYWLSLSLLVLIAVSVPWVSNAVAWRWKAIGGILRALEAFIVTVIVICVVVRVAGVPEMASFVAALSGGGSLTAEDSWLFVILSLVAMAAGVAGISLALPPSLLACLFFSSWWKSRTSASRQAGDAGVGAGG